MMSRLLQQDYADPFTTQTENLPRDAEIALLKLSPTNAREKKMRRRAYIATARATLLFPQKNTGARETDRRTILSRE